PRVPTRRSSDLLRLLMRRPLRHPVPLAAPAANATVGHAVHTVHAHVQRSGSGATFGRFGPAGLSARGPASLEGEGASYSSPSQPVQLQIVRSRYMRARA